jgi:predicted transcriptional regulator
MQIILTEDQAKVLRAIAKHKSISLSELLRRVVDDFIKEPLNPQQGRQTWTS